MISESARVVGADDVFVLRRVDEDRYFNIDGCGRGAGWAGVVSLEAGAEPLIQNALESGFARRSSGVPFRALGPYWCTEIVAVACARDMVVLGGASVGDAGDEALREAAVAIAAAAREVSSDKREADEEELRQAAASVDAIDARSLKDAAQAVAARAAGALSCEFGAVLLYGPPVGVVIADEGWRPAATDEEVITALLPLRDAVRGRLYVEQDASAAAFQYRPLSFADGLVARCAVEIGADEPLGLLVVAHAATAPRGFTSLCQRVAGAIAERAGGVLHAATPR